MLAVAESLSLCLWSQRLLLCVCWDVLGLTLLRIPAIAFRPRLDKPRAFAHLEILNLITHMGKDLFPNQVRSAGSRASTRHRGASMQLPAAQGSRSGTLAGSGTQPRPPAAGGAHVGHSAVASWKPILFEGQLPPALHETQLPPETFLCKNVSEEL